MRLKKNFKRWLSILLAVAVSLSSVMPTPVYAAGDESNDFAVLENLVIRIASLILKVRTHAKSCNRNQYIFAPA